MNWNRHVSRAAAGVVIGAGLLFWLPGGQVMAQTTVATEAALRAVMADPLAIGAILTADIDLTDCTGVPDAAVRRASGSTNFILEGNNHTIRQTCPVGSVLFYASTAGSFTVEDVTVTGGRTTGAVGGGGAGISSSAPLTIDRSTISGNVGNIGGVAGGFTGGVGNVTINQSTLTANSTNSGGPAGAFSRGTLTLINSTVTGNTGGVPALYDAGPGLTTLVYDTVVDNTGTSGANLFVANMSIFATVLALTHGQPNCSSFITPTVVSHGHNFSDDASCKLTATTDRQNAGDPGLLALANNGGPTETRLPDPSPLIDVIPLADCQSNGATGITTDQRLLPRPSGPGCDIGAVEVQEPTPTPPPATPPPASPRPMLPATGGWEPPPMLVGPVTPPLR
jgi:hypothetical protein